MGGDRVLRPPGQMGRPEARSGHRVNSLLLGGCPGLRLLDTAVSWASCHPRGREKGRGALWEGS